MKASELLELSYRQAKRCFARYQSEGDKGLVHRLRGQPSNRQADAKQKRRVLSLVEKKYADYGPTLAAECLSEEDGVTVAVETLRQWRLAAGLWRKQRRRKPYRQRRVRKAYFGEMVQMDGSHHDWFEGRRGWAVLMVLIDDATSEVFAWFSEGETTIAAMEAFQGYVQRYGLPRALYVDRDSIYRCERESTIAENLAGKEPATQFGRAMEELDVKVIMAHSPQAKGRVERVNGTLQDRLVKALRREKISDLAAANQFLQEKFLAAFQSAVREAGSPNWRLASSRATRVGHGPCAFDSGDTRGAKRLDLTIREPLVSVGRDASEAGVGGPLGDGVPKAGWAAGVALRRSRTELSGVACSAETAGGGGIAGDPLQSGATAGCGPSVEAAVAWGQSAGRQGGAGVAPARCARLRDAGPTLSGSVSNLSPRGHFYL